MKKKPIDKNMKKKMLFLLIEITSMFQQNYRSQL